MATKNVGGAGSNKWKKVWVKTNNYEMGEAYLNLQHFWPIFWKVYGLFVNWFQKNTMFQ